MKVFTLPEISHTNRELKLMLQGIKPLAVFSRTVKDDFDEMGGQNFDIYVKEGKFKKFTFFIKDKSVGSRLIYTAYSLPNEEWRVPIYRNIMSTLQTYWSKELELIQGILLGYSLEENVKHISEFINNK